MAGREVGSARKAEWDGGMLRRGMELTEWLSLSSQTAGGGPSVVERVRHRRVEHELWDGLGLGGIEGRGLIEE